MKDKKETVLRLRREGVGYSCIQREHGVTRKEAMEIEDLYYQVKDEQNGKT